ncbi:STAS domain-containing protein [Siminovitchia acidinfaciens]|uniref:STAS domain-containing protein n=1 Tax=Siminovitchia acidinfaciens TaxID=2321395 RepID=A0A429Y1H0_9BACI|nr:STAS domain-containing protein [Siminovitchia acidinfaciens]RST75075.1 STAS domain-containing protein [Siminovitchia acidinfaciens]
MKNELQYLGETILKNKGFIAQEIHEKRFAEVSMTSSEQKAFQQIEQQIIKIRADFVALFGEALVDSSDIHKANDKVRIWGEKTGQYIFGLGVPLDEALKDTSYYRSGIWQHLKEEVMKNNLSARIVFELISIIDPLMDKAVHDFSLTYVKEFQRSLESAKTSFLELSVPVVPLVPGVGVLPLIGNMDTERAHLLMEETLKQAGKLELTHLVLDISGVLIVDTMVADQLFKVIGALSLIGVKTIITGIRPEVAQTIVTLGLDLNHITVKANLHQAFKEIQLIKNL